MQAGAGMLVAGRYLLAEAVGQGGMGRVWRGHDQLLDRVVAVKEVILPPQSPREHAELLARTMREARAAARLDHPGVITIHDVVEHESSPWIVMQFVSGSSLRVQIDRDGRLPWQQIADIGQQAADALAAAHAAGIVHRDLKPDNILLSGRRAIVSDFGIARIIDATTQLTGTGVLIGTPLYMAPEHLDGGAIGPAADMWALGATLYAAVEGTPPFNGSTMTALMAAILTRTPARAQHAGPLLEVISALLSKDPAQRPNAQAVAHALAACRSGQAVSDSTPNISIAATASRDPQGTQFQDTLIGERPPSEGSRAPRATITTSGPFPPVTDHPARETEPSPIVSGRAGRGRARARRRRRAAIIALPSALVILAAAVGLLLTHSLLAASPTSDPQTTAPRDASLPGQPTPANTATASATSRKPAAQATRQVANPAGGSAPSSTPQAIPAGGSLFSHEFGTHSSPNYALDVLGQGEKAGQPIILFRTANSDPAQNWTVSMQGTTAQFYTSGLVGTAVAMHYGCIPGVNFSNCYGQTAVAVNDPAFEFEYAPNGVDSGLCMGVASTAVQDEGVTLQPCGVSARTVWIADVSGSPSTLSNGYIPLINGSDTNFSQPFVLTYPQSGYPTDMPRPQLQVDKITGLSQGFPPEPELGTVDGNQLWGR